MNKEQFEAQLMLDAKRSLSYNLVIEAIALKEEIQATEEDVNAKFEELAAQYNMGLEQIKAQVSPEAIQQEVVFKKTIDFLVENLNIQ